MTETSVTFAMPIAPTISETPPSSQEQEREVVLESRGRARLGCEVDLDAFRRVGRKRQRRLLPR